MKMYFFYNHFEQNQHAKFYNLACDLLRKANLCAFTSKNEVDIFVALVTRALQDLKPEGHPAKVVHTNTLNGGQISIAGKGYDSDIARISYSEITSFLEYDMDARDFFDVSDRLQEGGAA